MYPQCALLILCGTIEEEEPEHRAKDIFTSKFHSLPLLNVHKPLNLLHLICFCPHRENEVQYVIANVDKYISRHKKKLFYILYNNV